MIITTKLLYVNRKEFILNEKALSLVVSLIMMVSSFAFTTSAFTDDGIKVVINGKEQNYDVMPQIIDGRTMVPVRFIAESFGEKVNWNGYYFQKKSFSKNVKNVQ